MTLFKRTFGHERSASGKTLDRLVFGCIIVAVAIGFYAGWKALFITLAISAAVIFGVPFIISLNAKSPASEADKRISDMKWARVAYCAAFTVGTGLLASRGVSLWIVAPLAVFAAWWTILCTRSIWSEISFRIAVWRLHQAPSMEDWPAPRTVKKWEWLSNPKLDRWIDVGTILAVLCFPALLWVPIIVWVLK